MSWQSDVRPSCPPRLTHSPSTAVGSFGPEAVELAQEAGLELDDWQAWYLDGALAFRKDGKWAAFENGLDVPRQDGKGAIVETRVLAGLDFLDEKLLTYTAHEFKTAQEHFHRITFLVENCDRLRRKVKRIRKASGAESIEMMNGARLRFLARSAGSGRGFSGDVVFFDEAMILWAAAVGALLPTMSARTHVTAGGPQLYYFGTAGNGEAANVFANVRDRAIAGTDSSLFYAGWEAGEADDHTGENVDLDDRREWWRANPAMHGAGRITEEFIERERAALKDDEFARERLCIWGGAGLRSAIDPDVWRALGDPKSRPTGVVALAVDIPPEGKRASIGRAGLRSDGRVHGEIDTRPGTTWAVDRLAEIAKKRNAVVVLDGSSRAASLIPLLVAAGVTPIVYGTRQVVTACSGFMDKIDEDGLRHLAQPELNMAVDAARRRKVGDAWAWHRRDTSVDISSLVALTLAVQGLNEEPPRRKTGRSMAV
jgi:hypothetical protein